MEPPVLRTSVSLSVEALPLLKTVRMVLTTMEMDWWTASILIVPTTLPVAGVAADTTNAQVLSKSSTVPMLLIRQDSPTVWTPPPPAAPAEDSAA